MMTEIYHPDYMQRWKDMVYDFAKKTGKEDPDDYYEEGRWRTRRGATGLEVRNVSISDTPCNISDKARNIIIEKKISEDVLEFLKPLGDLKLAEMKDSIYISVYDYDKSNEYRKICDLIIKFGTNIIKVLPEHRIDATSLVNRIKCQMRKYQFCINNFPCSCLDIAHLFYPFDYLALATRSRPHNPPFTLLPKKHTFRLFSNSCKITLTV